MNLETDFEYKTLQFTPDYEGEVIATFISSKFNTGNRKSVLYIHGFIDYFFHPHLAKEFNENGFDFYAIDLRKYGRSLLPHQHPNYCANVEEYFKEITIVLKTIKEQNKNPLFLLGHSTGGLISSNYMNTGKAKDLVDGLILNSPFFAFNQSSIQNMLIPLVAKMVSSVAPYAKVSKGLSTVYAKSINKEFHGEWEYNLAWKPLAGFPTYFAWLSAISTAQKELGNSDISVPILVLHSSRSSKPKVFSEDALRADIVLNVEDMKSVGANLGSRVSFIEIENGMHDLFLSPKKVRAKAFEEIFGWLDNL